MIIALGFACFIAAAALDYADARNTQAVTERRAHAAARWSVSMYLIGLVGLVALTRVSLWLAVPECAGLYLGSWLAVRTRKDAE